MDTLPSQIEVALKALKKHKSIKTAFHPYYFNAFNKRVDWSTPSYLHENPLFTNESFKSRMINTSGALDGKHGIFT